MKEQRMMIYRIEQPHTYHLMEIWATEEVSTVDDIVKKFSRANTIVDAQFYYTNPLLYISCDEVSTEYAQLYEGLYLIPPKLYDTIEFGNGPLAVNSKFIEEIGSLSEMSDNIASPKPLRQELMGPEDQEPSVLDSLFSLYQEQGLYIIGIEK